MRTLDLWVPVVVGMMTIVALVMTIVISIIVQPIAFGFDQRYYADVGSRWLENGSFYWPHQLAGPYQFTVQVDVLYPPTALFLFVPAALAPAPLWWAVPLVVLGIAVSRWRPGRWAVCLALLLTAYHRSTWTLIAGNSDLWVVAAITGGLLWGWPGPLVILKPTMAPFAVAGIRRRSWWIASLVLIGLSVLLVPHWLDYVTAMSNLRGLEAGYSLVSVPLLLVPVVLWAGRKRDLSMTMAT